MHARLVLGVLINPLLGAEFVDQVGIAMTPGTELWYLGALDFSNKSMLGTHSSFRVVQSRVSAVTVRTTETPVLMNICAEGLSWGPQIAVERRVTLDTGILGLKTKRRKKPQQEYANPIASATSHR